MRRFVVLMIGATALSVSAATRAIEFMSVADEIAVLHDAPSTQSNKRLILTRGYPVELIIATGNWVRVRDEGGTFAWIESKRLDDKRTVMVSEALVEAHDSPGQSAPVVFRAEKGVILDFLELAGGWAKVRHRSGVTGFILLRHLWGV
ncbi:MAG: SH3 domain-containing protein [Burkholderiales bacterium]|nr:SH3 domain-containing protein [Burkholderiales bacterium]